MIKRKCPMIFANRAMLQSVFLCVLILMGSSSCVEVNITVPNEKAQKTGIVKTPSGIEIEVHRAVDIPLLAADVDIILADAERVSNGAGCSLNLSLNPREIPEFDHPKMILNRIDLDNLNARYGGVKVVNLIRWCEGDEDDLWSYDGCHKDGGIVVVRTEASREGILWLHELGHYFGLDHRDEQGALMGEFVQPINTNLNPNECAKYR